MCSGPGSKQHSEAAQIGEALKTVQAKIGSSLAAPQRPLLDLGIGLSYELDNNDIALLVRHLICAIASAALCSGWGCQESKLRWCTVGQAKLGRSHKDTPQAVGTSEMA